MVTLKDFISGLKIRFDLAQHNKQDHKKVLLNSFYFIVHFKNSCSVSKVRAPLRDLRLTFGGEVLTNVN